jgi:integrase
LQDGLIFLTENGRPVCNEIFRKALHRLCRKAGLRRVSPHSLRKAFVSQMTEAHGNIETPSRLAGHRDAQITREIYFRVSTPEARLAMGQLEERLFREKPIPQPGLHVVPRD